LPDEFVGNVQIMLYWGSNTGSGNTNELAVSFTGNCIPYAMYQTPTNGGHTGGLYYDLPSVRYGTAGTVCSFLFQMIGVTVTGTADTPGTNTIVLTSPADSIPVSTILFNCVISPVPSFPFAIEGEKKCDAGIDAAHQRVLMARLQDMEDRMREIESEAEFETEQPRHRDEPKSVYPIPSAVSSTNSRRGQGW